MARDLRLILMGPPGSGKGTQGKMLEGRLHILQISTGDMLRAAAREGTPLGSKVKAIIDGGDLVSDDVIVGIMSERMAQQDCRRGYILDGFPRTIEQARALGALLAKTGQGLTAAINLDIPDDDVVARLSGRRQCEDCGTGFHVLFKRPSREGVCDACGGALYQREDDNESTIRGRLAVYNRQTAPLIGFYEGLGLLWRVDGTGSIDEVFRRICSLIEKEEV